jgi:hypothetical protein
MLNVKCAGAWGLGYMVHGLGFRVRGKWFRIWFLGCGVHDSQRTAAGSQAKAKGGVRLDDLGCKIRGITAPDEGLLPAEQHHECKPGLGFGG